MNYWLDSHCHINDEAFKDDIKAVLDKMVESGVRRVMIVSCKPEDYRIAKEIKDDRLEIKRSIGIYPEYTNLSKEEIEEYEKYYKEVDAIGEIGLDYYWYKDTKEKQKELFISQIEVANKYNKPIIVHARDAIQDTYDILKSHKCRGVIHCFQGSKEMAKEFVKLGFYISIAGPITWKNAKELHEVIKVVPIDRLLIETDSPYLTPAPNRGKRNDPSNVIYVGKLIAEELNIEEEEFKKIINDNYNSLFGNFDIIK